LCVRGEGGHLEVLKWARENSCPWDGRTCTERGEGRPPRDAEVGARERLPVGRCRRAIAAVCGHFELLRWARENGAPWDEITRRNAASKGYVEP
jgi:hypothetical protein